MKCPSPTYPVHPPASPISFTINLSFSPELMFSSNRSRSRKHQPQPQPPKNQVSVTLDNAPSSPRSLPLLVNLNLRDSVHDNISHAQRELETYLGLAPNQIDPAAELDPLRKSPVFQACRC